MFKFLTIFSFLVFVVHATGKFSIVQYPKSLEFKGEDRLDSNFVGDVLSAALGLYVDTESKWGGLYINDPFELPKGAINIIIEGVKEINLNSKTKSFPIYGEVPPQESLRMILSATETFKSPVLNIDLNSGVDSLLSYTEILGDIQIPATLKSTENLKPEKYPEDKLFLQQIAALNTLSKQLPKLTNKPFLVNINLSLKQLISAHGMQSPSFSEVLKTLADTIGNFGEESRKTYDNQLLFTVITDDDIEATISRQKRQAQLKANEDLNLATEYNQDYPVIFNIVLWFMIIFVFSLIAISYVIATMDPGRDSIIYRMTSTRMKKDN